MKFHASPLAILFGLCLITPVLSGCESLDGRWNERSPTVSSKADTQASKEAVDNLPQKLSRLDDAPGVRDVPNFPVPQDRDLKIMTSKLSGGSVEVYDLDNNTTADASVPPVQPYYQGIPMATDPRVTVYPLDDSGSYPGQFTAAPTQGWPNSVLPVGNSDIEMSPLPGGLYDEPMKVVGGKLTPVVNPNRSSVYFSYGSARIDGENNRALNEVAETAKFAPVDRVSVEGYASKPTQTDDPVKAKILNLKESMNRAQAVSQNLIQKGVPADKIKTVGWGDTKPMGGNEAAERRVDIVTAAGL